METEVKRIAKLARLKIDDDKLASLTREMNDIVQMMENLPEMNNEDTPLDPNDTMILREDIAMASSCRDDILMNAPHKENGCFLVPQTVD